jgi:hypothetical protein
LVEAFLKKWWVESDFKAPNLPLSLRIRAKKNQKQTKTKNRTKQYKTKYRETHPQIQKINTTKQENTNT